MPLQVNSNGPGLNFSWPMVGVIVAMLISIVSGAIQLGTVQTHVLINTTRLDLLESYEHERIGDIAQLKARQERDERRIDALEAIRPTNGELAGSDKALNSQMNRLEERVKSLEAVKIVPNSR